MNASNRDTLRSIVARRRGRVRLQAATVALGAASLAGAGAAAYWLPGPAHVAGATSASTAQGSSAVHTVSGGSAATATQGSAQAGAATAPAASTGASHAASGGS